MTFIIGLVLLGLLVFLHELGHFFTARICGVRVEAFSIGMGPVLIHKEFFGTDWRLSLLPFGGYCAMKGEKDFEEGYYRSSELEKDSFYGVRALFRAFIAFGGPFANFLFSAFAFFLISLIGYSYYSASNSIVLATEAYPELHSAAADAGLMTGDKIIRINSCEITDFTGIYEEVALHGDEDIQILVERGGEKIEFTVHTDLDKKTGEGKIGVMSMPDSVVKKEAPRYSFLPAMGRGFSETIGLIKLSLKGILSLFKGVDIMENVAGPARITSMLGQTARSGFSADFRSGFSAVLRFMA
ncbi:MAG: site-2 protease family protein, partial [Treponema sp.]|nr:site-2 protease family protein [Treponema sp.]